MKAKKIVSTEKESRVVFEMSEEEATNVLSLFSRASEAFSLDSRLKLYVEDYDLGQDTKYFKAALELR